MADRPRTPVLFVHHRSELGGAPASLSYLIRELERDDFDAHIYCPPGPAAELFRQAGAEVHTGPVAGFTHIWASTYRGRRWLLFLRELAFVPAHVVRFRRILRRNRFQPRSDEDAKAALGLPGDRPVVSYFGFIYPSKGFREFIQAAARLRDEGIDASYLIVGGAVRGEEFFQTVVGRGLQLADLTRDYESEANRLVDELGLSDDVRFIPFTQDTAGLYQ